MTKSLYKTIASKIFMHAFYLHISVLDVFANKTLNDFIDKHVYVVLLMYISCTITLICLNGTS